MEPEPGVEQPRADAEDQHAADGDGRVVEVGLCDGVRHWQGEEHGEECHPGDGDPADDEAAPRPEMERPRDEGFPCRRDAEEDGQCVGDVQPRRRHGDHRLGWNATWLPSDCKQERSVVIDDAVEPVGVQRVQSSVDRRRDARTHRKAYDEREGDGEPDGVEGHLVPVHPVSDQGFK